jgi:hypothetical protein
LDAKDLVLPTTKRLFSREQWNVPVPFKITHDQLNQLIDRREYKEIPLGSLVECSPFSHSLERLDSPRFSGTGNQPWKWKIHPKKIEFSMGNP